MTMIKPYMHITNTILRVAESVECIEPHLGYYVPTQVEAEAADAVQRALAFKGLKSVDNPHPEPQAPAAIRGNPEQFVTGAGVRK